ncbi:MAG: BlaI/MecI/CopY family transcriptional regulator [Clostridia bacterium]|nr:BlaI/MecI/CopY family transcriptional regulator [Clostridia bacterium]MBQ9922222.1 BlaI/MecI/CopY family transcriptional regulator [Clostridia bacterium]
MTDFTRQAEKLPESELEIMLTLWKVGKAMTAGEITKHFAKDKGWKSATVHVLLDRLAEKGFVSCDKSSFKHLYSPLITEESYRKGETTTFLSRFFGGSAKQMIASFITADSLSDEDLDELSAMINERKAGLK